MMNEFCKGGGCTAKLGPGILDKVLKMIPKKADPNLLVGFDHSDGSVSAYGRACSGADA